jgi:hypothetical protein
MKVDQTPNRKQLWISMIITEGTAIPILTGGMNINASYRMMSKIPIYPLVNVYITMENHNF